MLTDAQINAIARRKIARARATQNADNALVSALFSGDRVKDSSFQKAFPESARSAARGTSKTKLRTSGTRKAGSQAQALQGQHTSPAKQHAFVLQSQGDTLYGRITNPDSIELALKDALDCGFCGLRCDEKFPPENGGFDTFDKLAQHVWFCPFAPLPKHRTDLDLASARILAANRVQEERMKGKNMDGYLPPAPSRDAVAGSFGKFLPAKELKRGKKIEVRILDVRDLGISQFDKTRKQFGLDVKFGKELRTISINVDSPNHRILSETLGKKWIGKSITIERRPTSFGNDMVAVVDPRS